MHFAVTLKNQARLIGYDVTVPGESYGDAEPGLDWLADRLKADTRLPILIAMHQHPFASGIAELDENNCRNADKLLAVLAASSNVAGVTCGHGHRAIFTRFGAIPAMMCPSLSPANPLKLGRSEPVVIDVPGLMVHSFDAAGLHSHVVSIGLD
jgi:hypothetical protein